MKVKQVIEKLSKLNQEAELVMITNDGDIAVTTVGSDYDLYSDLYNLTFISTIDRKLPQDVESCVTIC